MSYQEPFTSPFPPESERRLAAAQLPPWKILLVDDDPGILSVLGLALQDVVVAGRGLCLLGTRCAEEAKSRMPEHPDIALVILEVVRETERAVLDLIHYLRRESGSRALRIVLVTGQPGYAPPRDLVRDYAIEGYCLKTELACDKAYFLVCSALRAYCALRDLDSEREELKKAADHLQRAEEMLHDGEERHWTIIQTAIDGFWVVDMEGRLVEVNDTYCRMSGYSEQELLAMRIADLEVIETPEESAAHIRTISETGQDRFESQHRRNDGTVFDVEIRTQYQPVGGGQCVAFIQDITERKKSEKRILRLTHLYAALNQCSQDIVRCESEEELFPRICRDAVQLGGMRMAFIGLIDPGTSSLVSVASYGEGTDYLREVKISTDPASPFGQGPSGVAVREKRPYWCQDFHGDPATSPWQEIGDAFGWKASASLPLFKDGAVLGALTLYSGDVNAFDDAEKNLLVEMSKNIGNALDNYAREAARKEAECLLRRSEDQISRLLQSTDQGIYGTDRQGCCTFINNSGLQMLGYRLEDCLGKHMHHLIHHSAFDGTPYPLEDCPIFQAKLRNGGVCRVDNEVAWRSDGTPLSVEYSSHPILEDGEMCGLVVTFSDITGRKQAFKQLEEITQRLQLATSSAHLGVWDWNIRDNRKIWDDRLYEIYGLTRDLVPDVVDPWESGLHPDDKGAATAARQAALDGERDYDIIFRICRPDGAVRHIKANAIVIRGNDGAAERMIGVNADITEILRAEEEKAKLEAQLNQAQKMESVGRLAGGVAHDFNNLLTVILGHAQLALTYVEPDEPLSFSLQEIRKAAERSADLTRQLLAFARKQTIMPRVLDLNETVSGMLKMLQRLIGEGVNLKWSPAPVLWQVLMDPSQLDQILANLCVNARDAIVNIGKIFIETGTAAIDDAYCTAHPEAAPGGYVWLSVRDNGCGIDKETVGHIFEPFFTTKGIGEGTGLGLSTVYGIVKQNKGFINVYSEVGHGTTFTIFIPRYTDAGTSAVAEDDGIIAPLPRGNETILLVEDDPAIMTIASMLLEKQGYTVLATSVPGEAIRLANEHGNEIHLLVTDVVMPETNGRDLAKELRMIRPRLKCLFMSGYTSDIIAQHGVIDEGLNFIQKPFPDGGLARKVREVLDFSTDLA